MRISHTRCPGAFGRRDAIGEVCGGLRKKKKGFEDFSRLRAVQLRATARRMPHLSAPTPRSRPAGHVWMALCESLGARRSPWAQRVPSRGTFCLRVKCVEACDNDFSCGVTDFSGVRLSLGPGKALFEGHVTRSAGGSAREHDRSTGGAPLLRGLQVESNEPKSAARWPVSMAIGVL